MNSTTQKVRCGEGSGGVVWVQLDEMGECEEIGAELKTLEGWAAAQVRDAKDAEDYEVLTRRDVRSSSMLLTAEAEKFYRQFDARMDAKLKPLVKQHWRIDLTHHSGTHLVRYGAADHYWPHLDTGPGPEDRYLSVVCYLNDDFSGGQTSFPGLNYVAPHHSGKPIFFPSNYYNSR